MRGRCAGVLLFTRMKNLVMNTFLIIFFYFLFDLSTQFPHYDKWKKNVTLDFERPRTLALVKKCDSHVFFGILRNQQPCVIQDTKTLSRKKMFCFQVSNYRSM